MKVKTSRVFPGLFVMDADPKTTTKLSWIN